MVKQKDRRRVSVLRGGGVRSGATTALSAATIVIAGLGGATQLVEGPAAALPVPFAALIEEPVSSPVVTSGRTSADAFGRSGEVKVRFALPGAPLEFPIQVNGDPSLVRYLWVRVTDGVATDSARALGGAEVTAPSEPGFYHLALVAGEKRRTLSELTIGVLVPFEEKQGVWLGGYRIGNYRAEGAGRGEQPPPGFVKVSRADADLRLTRHLRVSDFLTHDGQKDWPRYAALDTRLLDKIELVMAEVGRWRGNGRPAIAIDVHSGFRTPWYNRSVRRAARDSRHQYGDAADVVIDADGDGRYTARDTYLVEVAVDQVEMRYPDLAGGTGIYRSRHYRTPYVHIDARGHRSRWRS